MAGFLRLAKDRMAVLGANQIAVADIGLHGEAVDFVAITAIGDDHEFPVIMRMEIRVIAVNLMGCERVEGVIRIKLKVVHVSILSSRWRLENGKLQKIVRKNSKNIAIAWYFDFCR